MTAVSHHSGYEECSMSDTTPNNGRNESDDAKPETDATTPPAPANTGSANTGPTSTGPTGTESAKIDYAATRERENFTGTGSHSAVPAPADDYAAPRDSVAPEPESAQPESAQPESAQPDSAQPTSAFPAPVSAAPVTEPVPEPLAPTQSATQSPVYVQAPQRPVDRSNRGVGVLIALLATAVFAVIYATAVFIIAGVTSATIAVAVTTFAEFAVLPVFYIPVVFFFLAFALLVVILNRSG